MKCAAVKDRLMQPAGNPVGESTTRHLDGCPSCRRFAESLSEMRRDLRDHHAGHEPDAAFAARVSSRFESDPGEMVGRAALRLLPISAVLLLLLLWISAGTDPREPELTSEESTQATIDWVLQSTDEAS
jgi:hypothetical protein